MGRDRDRNDSAFSTVGYADLISHTDDPRQFKEEILPLLQGERMAWGKKIQEIIAQKHYSQNTMATMCDVSRTMVAKWCAGALPSSRSDYIRIGFAAEYNLEEMDFFLKRFGHYPGLYARSLEDSVYIFVLSSDPTVIPHTYHFCKELLKTIQDNITLDGSADASPYSTVQAESILRSMASPEELKKFIQNNTAVFKEAYARLYSYILTYLRANNYDSLTGRDLSVKAFLDYQGNWTSSLSKCIYKIRKKEWFPLRRKVIALGLHLNMTLDEINRMLELARMETLCAKNPVEGAIIFAVTDAELKDLIFRDGGTDLCDYVRSILETMEIPDAESLLKDL